MQNAFRYMYKSYSGAILPSKPLAPLQLMTDTSTPVGVYLVNAPDEGGWPMQLALPDSLFVTFLIRVDEVAEATSVYLVQVCFGVQVHVI